MAMVTSVWATTPASKVTQCEDCDQQTECTFNQEYGCWLCEHCQKRVDLETEAYWAAEEVRGDYSNDDARDT